MFPPIRLREALSLGGLSVRELVSRTWRKIVENEIMTRASAISFYAMLALVPFLGLMVAIMVDLLPDLRGPSGATIGFGNMTIGELRQTLARIFPREAYSVIEDQVTSLQKQPKAGFISLGLAATLWLASSLFVAIIDAMNRIYGVIETRSLVKLRITAIVMTVLQAVLMVGSLLSIVAGNEFLKWLGISQSTTAFATILQWLTVEIVVLLSFALTFYVAPDAEQSWEWITPGSLVGSVVFLLVSFGFRLYVKNFANYNKTYGSLGGVMVLLFWFWISSLVLLSAAQMNKVIEEASPLGKPIGQKKETPLAPDFESMKPEPWHEPA